jgi:hypothetical protein
MVSLFERLGKGRPPPAEDRPKPETNTVGSELARDLQKLHDWLQNDWNKPTVCLRDICYRGPNSMRNRKRAINLTEILVGHGWLIPNPTRRRDRKEWQIVRGRGVKTVATMNVATETTHPTPLQGD